MIILKRALVNYRPKVIHPTKLIQCQRAVRSVSQVTSTLNNIGS